MHMVVAAATVVMVVADVIMPMPTPTVTVVMSSPTVMIISGEGRRHVNTAEHGGQHKSQYDLAAHGSDIPPA
jgi:hypothetical protein